MSSAGGAGSKGVGLFALLGMLDQQLVAALSIPCLADKAFALKAKCSGKPVQLAAAAVRMRAVKVMPTTCTKRCSKRTIPPSMMTHPW